MMSFALRVVSENPTTLVPIAQNWPSALARPGARVLDVSKGPSTRLCREKTLENIRTTCVYCMLQQMTNLYWCEWLTGGSLVESSP